MRKKFLLSLIILFVVALAALCYTGCRGKQGEKGNDGVHLTGAFIDDGELYIVLSDDVILNCGKVVGTNGVNGIDGLDGYDGLGIEKIEATSAGSFIIYFTDDTHQIVTIEPRTCEHEFPDEWNEVTQATCTEYGHKYRNCLLCGYMEHEIEEPHGHNWDEQGAVTVVEPLTCNDSGCQLVTCLDCHESKVVEIPPHEHVYERTQLVAENRYVYTCVHCGQRKATDGIQYQYDMETSSYMVVGLSGCTDPDIVIPDSVLTDDGYVKVTRIQADFCKDLQLNINSLYLPATITGIYRHISVYGMFGYEHCNEIKNITVNPRNPVYRSDDNCIIEIATKQVVAGCAISSIPSDGSVTTVGSYAFSSLSNLTRIVIPDKVVTLSAYAFTNSGLVEIEVGGSLKLIGDYCFNNCESLETADLSGVSLSIGASAFSTCKALKEVTLNKGCFTVSQKAFLGCTSLETVHIASTVARIGVYAFSHCASLTSVFFEGTASVWCPSNGFGVVEKEFWHNDYIPGMFGGSTPITNATVIFGRFN